MEFTLDGMKDVIDKLNALPLRLKKNALRKGVRAGSNIIRDAARQNVPVDSGLTKRNIVTIVTSNKDEVISKVGVRGGGRNKGNNPYWWRFVELGYFSKQMGRYVKANPFMRNAQSNNVDTATNKVAESINAELDQ